MAGARRLPGLANYLHLVKIELGFWVGLCRPSETRYFLSSDKHFGSE